MEAAVSSRYSHLTWDLLGAGSQLPEGLEQLELPKILLPEEIMAEINVMGGLTRLECIGTGFWPSQDLSVGLKVTRNLPASHPRRNYAVSLLYQVPFQ